MHFIGVAYLEFWLRKWLYWFNDLTYMNHCLYDLWVITCTPHVLLPHDMVWTTIYICTKCM